MGLQSKLFKGDSKLEDAAVRDAAHIIPGARGAHVGKIQQALIELDGAKIQRDDSYGPATTAAVLAYKRKRNIINPAYQTQADNIVGRMTIARLDAEMYAKEPKPGPGPGPDPQPDPGPLPNLMLNFAMTDPSIYVELKNGAAGIATLPATALTVVDPSSFYGGDKDKTKWIEVKCEGGKSGVFKVTKKGTVFWVLMFVPKGTRYFDRGYVFFHPSPTQVFVEKKKHKIVQHVVASDQNYEGFGSDWEGLAKRYLANVGQQMAAAKQFTLILPMMRMAAFTKSTAVNDVFAEQPLETLLSLLEAARTHLSDLGISSAPTEIGTNSIATASFSSGIVFHANLFDRIKNSGKLVEAVDFDSTYIRTAHQDITAFKGGPRVLRHTQKEKLISGGNEFHFPVARWNMTAVNAPDDLPGKLTTGDVHHRIVDHTLYGAVSGSLLLSGN